MDPDFKLDQETHDQVYAEIELEALQCACISIQSSREKYYDKTSDLLNEFLRASTLCMSQKQRRRDAPRQRLMKSFNG